MKSREYTGLDTRREQCETSGKGGTDETVARLKTEG